MKDLNQEKGANLLLTGQGLNMLTTEAEEEYKSNPVRETCLRDSINFSNGAGKISAIDFHGGEKKDLANSISFEGSMIEKHRSDFNEELLASSAASQNNRPDGIPSKEFTLKPAKQLSINKGIEVSIDIEWPAERIEQEYRKQQAQKNQLLFGPNWEFKGEAFDLDKAKKEIYHWKRDEEKRRSMAIAQEPAIDGEGRDELASIGQAENNL